MSFFIPPATIPNEPLYRQIKRAIFEAIRDGRWKPGELLPSEQRLAREFSVSQGTLRKAIDALVHQKLIIRRQGKGSFVATHSIQHDLFHFFHLVDRYNRRELPYSVVEHILKRRATKHEGIRLQLKTGDSIVEIKRVRHLGDAPMINERILLPGEIFATLKERHHPLPNTLYQLYQEHYAITIAQAVENLRAVAADDADANSLHIPVGTPLLEIERTALDLRALPVEIRISRCLTTHYQYLNVLE